MEWYAEQQSTLTRPAEGTSGGSSICVPASAGFIGDKMKTKKCSKCKTIKPISEFNIDKQNKDGFRGYCKSCKKIYEGEYRQTEHGKAMRKHYFQSKKGKIAIKRHQQSEKGKNARKRYKRSEKGKATEKRYLARNLNRIKARHVINNAIRDGKLVSPKLLLCRYCPKPAKEYHHYLGYEPEFWFAVAPVCIDCHRNSERKIA